MFGLLFVIKDIGTEDVNEFGEERDGREFPDGICVVKFSFDLMEYVGDVGVDGEKLLIDVRTRSNWKS